jgi:hypothetical protein
MSAAITVYGLRVVDPLWLATALESAAEAHDWGPKGVPKFYQEKLAELRRRAEQLAWEADTLASLFGLNDVEGVEGVIYEETTLDELLGEEDDEDEPWQG